MVEWLKNFSECNLGKFWIFLPQNVIFDGLKLRNALSISNSIDLDECV